MNRIPHLALIATENDAGILLAIVNKAFRDFPVSPTISTVTPEKAQAAFTLAQVDVVIAGALVQSHAAREKLHTLLHTIRTSRQDAGRSLLAVLLWGSRAGQLATDLDHPVILSVTCEPQNGKPSSQPTDACLRELTDLMQKRICEWQSSGFAIEASVAAEAQNVEMDEVQGQSTQISEDASTWSSVELKFNAAATIQNGTGTSLSCVAAAGSENNEAVTLREKFHDFWRGLSPARQRNLRTEIEILRQTLYEKSRELQHARAVTSDQQILREQIVTLQEENQKLKESLAERAVSLDIVREELIRFQTASRQELRQLRGALGTDTAQAANVLTDYQKQLRAMTGKLTSLLEVRNSLELALESAQQKRTKSVGTTPSVLPAQKSVVRSEAVPVSQDDEFITIAKRHQTKLRPLVEEVIAMVAPLLSGKPVTMELAIDLTAETLSSEPETLRQILFNLISNAVLYTDAGHVSVTARGHDDVVTISVSDTGIGISRERLQHLLSSAAQSDSNASDCGLREVQRLVDECHGSLVATSQPGVGSTFTVTLTQTVVHSPTGQAIVAAS